MSTKTSLFPKADPISYRKLTGAYAPVNGILRDLSDEVSRRRTRDGHRPSTRGRLVTSCAIGQLLGLPGVEAAPPFAEQFSDAGAVHDVALRPTASLTRASNYQKRNIMDLTVEDQVEGTAQLDGNVLTIGSSGRIRTEVSAKAVIVMGKVDANMTATETVSIREGASVEGNVVAPPVPDRHQSVERSLAGQLGQHRRTHL